MANSRASYGNTSAASKVINYEGQSQNRTNVPPKSNLLEYDSIEDFDTCEEFYDSTSYHDFDEIFNDITMMMGYGYNKNSSYFPQQQARSKQQTKPPYQQKPPKPNEQQLIPPQMTPNSQRKHKYSYDEVRSAILEKRIRVTSKYVQARPPHLPAAPKQFDAPPAKHEQITKYFQSGLTREQQERCERNKMIALERLRLSESKKHRSN